MANSSTIIPLPAAQFLPNPFTPLAFLPPDTAYQLTMALYVYVGEVAILVWDVLVHLDDDYRLLIEHKVTVSTLIYYLSRLSALAYSVLSLVFQTAPLGNCVKLAKLPCSVYHVAVSSTAMLFLFRVRAVFNNSKYVTITFFVMWLAVVGGSLTVITGLQGGPIGNTQYCAFIGALAYSSLSNITLVVFDTCVFAAITWHMLSFSNSELQSDRLWGKLKFMGGHHLPRFSKAFLQQGQSYYLVAVITNLLVLIMTHLKAVPIPYQTIFFVPAVGLTNILACHVFRQTKLGSIPVGTPLTLPVSSPNIVFNHQRSGFATHSDMGTQESESAIQPYTLTGGRPTEKVVQVLNIGTESIVR